MKVAFIIGDLNNGGAERQLVVTALELSNRRHRVSVVSLRSGGSLVNYARSRGLEVLEVGNGLVGALRLRRHVTRRRYDVAYAYMPKAQVLTTLALLGTRRPKIVWGIRASSVDLTLYGVKSRVIWRLSQHLSHRADWVICNSWAGLRHHVLNGFPASRIQVIPNGIDTEVFTINDVKREQFRSSLGFDHDLPIIGMLARFDPIKGHSEFTKVVRELTIDSQKRFGVVLVGGGDAVLAAKACRELEELLPPDLVRVLPDTPQPERVLNGLDVLLVCSQSEGFPNVAAEAMACGCEVAGFAVGDLAQIVLGPELLSLNSSTKDLAGIVSRLLAIGRSRSRKVELREKIVSNFSIQRMGSATENCLARLTGEHQ